MGKRGGRTAVAIVDGGPPERAEHANVVERTVYNTAGSAIGKGRRAVSSIERVRGLDDDQREAAERLRADYECAVHGVVDRDAPATERVQRGRRSMEPTEMQVEASRRLASARLVLTGFERPVVEAVVCDELTIELVAQLRRMYHAEAKGVLRAGLARLAIAYGITRRAA